MGMPKNSWYMMENPLKMYDLGGRMTVLKLLLPSICRTITHRELMDGLFARPKRQETWGFNGENFMEPKWMVYRESSKKWMISSGTPKSSI